MSPTWMQVDKFAAQIVALSSVVIWSGEVRARHDRACVCVCVHGRNARDWGRWTVHLHPELSRTPCGSRWITPQRSLACWRAVLLWHSSPTCEPSE